MENHQFNTRRKRRYLITNGEVPLRTQYKRKRQAKVATLVQQAGLDQSMQEEEEIQQCSSPKDSSSERSSLSVKGVEKQQLSPTRNSTSERISLFHTENGVSSLSCTDDDDGQSHDQQTFPDKLAGSSNSDITDENQLDDGSGTNTIHPAPEENSCNQSLQQDEQGVSDEENNTANNTPSGNQRLLTNVLIPGLPVTEGDVLLMCLSLGIRHNASWTLMVDILKMINVICDYEAVGASKYYLQKFFDVGKDSVKFHIYCPRCEANLGVREQINPFSPCDAIWHHFSRF